MGKKKRIAVAAICACAVLTAAGTTMAMLSQKTQSAANEFNGTAVNIGVLEKGKVLEEGANGANLQEYPEIKKDVPVEKKVKISNMNDPSYPTTDTYVRVRLVPVFRDKYDKYSVAADLTKIQYIYGNTDNLWKKEEADNGETYYYYTKALLPGEETSELITAVMYTGDVPEGTILEVQVLTEGIAAKQEGSLGAWGVTSFDNLSEL